MKLLTYKQNLLNNIFYFIIKYLEIITTEQQILLKKIINKLFIILIKFFCILICILLNMIFEIILISIFIFINITQKILEIFNIKTYTQNKHKKVYER